MRPTMLAVPEGLGPLPTGMTAVMNLFLSSRASLRFCVVQSGCSQRLAIISSFLAVWFMDSPACLNALRLCWEQGLRLDMKPFFVRLRPWLPAVTCSLRKSRLCASGMGLN